MLRFIAQHRVLLLILVLVLIGLHLLSSGLKKQTELTLFGKAVLVVYNPLYQFFSWPFRKVKNVFNDYLFLVHVKRHNAELEAKNRELSGKLAALDELAAENKRLLALLQMKENKFEPVAFARVIGRSNLPEFRVITIDAGSNERVQKGMPVVAPEGLVGFVADSAPGAAKVVLITDPKARIDALIQRKREPVMVFGQGSNECLLQYYDHRDIQVAEEDSIVTSGADEVFPKGLLIGHVSRIIREQDTIRSITVKPVVDLDALEEVMVMPPGPGAAGLTP